MSGGQKGLWITRENLAKMFYAQFSTMQVSEMQTQDKENIIYSDKQKKRTEFNAKKMQKCSLPWPTNKQAREFQSNKQNLS